MYVGFKEQIKQFNEIYGVESNAEPLDLGEGRLRDFKKIFTDELDEFHDIKSDGLDRYVDLADWLSDLYVYLASEAQRWGVLETLPVQQPGYVAIEDLKTFYYRMGHMVSSIDRPLLLAFSLARLAGEVSYRANAEGIRLVETLPIVMESNFSKLGADGKPIIDETGKIRKGPNFQPPEPKLKELLNAKRILGQV